MGFAFYQPYYLLIWLLIPFAWIMLLRSSHRAPTWKYRWAIGSIRTGLIAVLGIALAEPRIVENSDQVNLFYVVDESESIGKTEKQQVQGWLDEIADQASQEDRSGLIVFGKSPSLESPLQADYAPAEIRSQINANFSNLYDALQLAIGQFPRKGKNRILLFSDGNQNKQDALEMAYLAQSLGIEIYPIPLSSWFEENEVFVEKLETPARTVLDTPFDIRLVVNSTMAGEGDLVLTKNGNLLLNETVILKPGKNVFSYVDSLQEQGLFLYKAILNSGMDTAFQNNEWLSFTQAAKHAEVLYLADPDRNQIPLITALEQQGVGVVRRSVDQIPSALHQLLDYSAVIFDNVSGQDLAQTTMSNLENYVKDMGGGLVMIGGDQSFGAGHFLKTPIENILPVQMDSSQMEMPSLTLVLIIDKSSSMAGLLEEKKRGNLFGLTLASKTKLESAKIAAFASVEILSPLDKVGIMAFNEEFEWSVPIIEASRQREIAQKLKSLGTYGGTNLYPGLKEAFTALQSIESVKKHIIVLSDGDTKEADFRTLAKDIRDAKITLSTVSIGEGSTGIKLLKSLARWGGGRDYHTDDPTQIPRIFVNETKIVAKELIQEKNMNPASKVSSEILSGIPLTTVPSVQGLVTTFPKPGAQVLFDTEEGPLLVSWQYGLGRSVVFTSDLTGRWSKDWIEWNQFNKFAAQLVKWVRKKESIQNFDIRIQKQEDAAHVLVNVSDNQGRFINHLPMQIKVLSPNNEEHERDLNQIAPGRYEATFPAVETGEYFATLTRTNQDTAIPIDTVGFGVPYTDEYQTHTINYALLDEIAAITQGQRLDPENLPESLFTTDSDATVWGFPLWPYFTFAFVLLLVGDVALRKFSELLFQ